MKKAKPVVFEYLDAYQYLQDYYAFRKKLDAGFSYESWAVELNFNSRSFLRMMIYGKKKLTDKVVEKTPVVLAAILKVSEEVLLEGLAVLHNLKLIELSTTGKWSSQVDAFRVPDNKGSLNLRKFHEKSLREACQAFDYPKEVRRYKSLLLPMTLDDYEVFNHLLDDFAKEQMARHNPKTYSGRRLFQLNFNIYPVSESLEKTTE
ncbi:MAG: DUF4423 domain-containing protein [Bdellovibrio sp.]|nr:DUF4423 domain-containing protein [Bdellovibrio sp.]